MKKTLLFLGLASVMSAFIACSKDDAVSNNGSDTKSTEAPQTIVAQMTEDGTRTAIAPGGKSIAWSMDDALGVFSDDALGNIVNYKLTAGEGTTTGTFTKTSTVGGVGPVPYSHKTTDQEVAYFMYVGVYPASSFYYSVAGKGREIGGVVPQDQEYTQGTYDKGAFPMVGMFADAASANMKFKYLAALVRMPLKGDMTLTQIELANANTDVSLASPLSGRSYYQFEQYTFDKDGGDAFFFDPSKQFSLDQLRHFGDMAGSVRLNGNMLLTAQGEDFYLAMLGGRFADGFVVRYTLDDMSKIEKKIVPSSQNTTVLPGEVISLPETMIAAPYFADPVIDVTTLSYTADATMASSYALVVNYGEAKLGEVALTGDVDLNTVLPAIVSPYVGPGMAFSAGEDVTLSLTIKAVYVDKTVAEATYSAPVDFTYSIPLPQISASIIPAKNGLLLQVTNWKAYDKIEFAVVNVQSAAESDFASATFTTITDQNCYYLYPFDGAVIGHHTLMLRGSIGAESVTKLIEQEIVPEEKPDPAMKVTIAKEGWEGNYYCLMKFEPTDPITMQEYLTKLVVSEVKILYVYINSVGEAGSADWSSAVDVSPVNTSELNFGDYEIQGLDATKFAAFKVQITGQFGEDTTVSTKEFTTVYDPNASGGGPI